MKIHQITHLFHPDSLAGAALYTDFVQAMRARGHDVRVTTTFSYYPRLCYEDADRKTSFREEVFNGVPLRRVAMVLPRHHRGWRRLIPEATFLWALRRHGRFPDWKPDVIVTACPMLAQPLAARTLYGVASRVPIILIVQDLMADAALRLGIIKQPWLGKILVAAERRALLAANRIVTISEEMKGRLRELTNARREIEVIPNWIHDTLEQESQRVRERATARSAQTLFYSGNIGVKQGLPEFLRDFFTGKSGWKLTIHGDGAEMEKLRSACADYPDVGLKPLLPEGEYVQALAGASICLITQREGAGESFLPSKLLPALATGTPVLAVCEARSPLGREVVEGKFGAVIAPGDAAGLAEVLNRWHQKPDELTQLSANARARASIFTREKAMDAYERLLLQMVGTVPAASRS